ncbi:hypothetical protein LCGC14_1717290 [marine sediment metagenome]|uniref:Uncharacterized protein n=1 Tax=marine sediment metagenome TaxID=412755 RepID=A0A0F9HDQ0_9ZZZZ
MIATTSNFKTLSYTSDTADSICGICTEAHHFDDNGFETTVTFSYTSNAFIGDNDVRITKHGIFVRRHAIAIKIITQERYTIDDLIYKQKRLRSLVLHVSNMRPTKLVNIYRSIVKYRVRERGIGARNFHKV